MINFETGSIREAISSISLPSSLMNLSLGNLSKHDLENISIFNFGNPSSPSVGTALSQSSQMPEDVHPRILTPGAADPGEVFMAASEGRTTPDPRDLRSDERRRRQSAPVPSRAHEDKYAGADGLIVWDPNTKQEMYHHDDFPYQRGRSQQHFSWDAISPPIRTGPPVPSKDEGHRTNQVNGNGNGEGSSLTRRMYNHGNRTSRHSQHAQGRTQPQQHNIPQAPQPPTPESAERVQLLLALRSDISRLAFSSYFIDKIPSRPTWYHLEHSTRKIRKLFSRSERKLVKKMDQDMYAFHDAMKKDSFILSRAPERHNSGLRWNVAKLMWEIVRQEVLEYDGRDDARTLEARTVRYIERALWPFLSQHVNPEELLEAIRGVARQAARLRWTMKVTPWSWYGYTLPPNREGTIVGDGTKRHVDYVSLDGTDVKGDGPRGLYGTIYQPLVKYTRYGDGGIKLEVECPAIVADYCPEEQENKSAYFFIAEDRD